MVWKSWALTLCLMVSSVTIAVAQEEIPLGNEPILLGKSSHTADHVPPSASWVPASSNEMLDALGTFSRYLTSRLGFNPKLDGLERFIHYTGPGSPIRPKMEARGTPVGGWWGHCNGEAAAMSLEKEPVAITRSNVPFSVDQLKAVLAEAYYEAGALMRGTRSFIDATQYTEAKRLIGTNAPLADWRNWYRSLFRTDAPANLRVNDIRDIAERGVMKFEDMNPAEMHRALRTVMGKAKLPMVFETSAGETVWNWGAWAFETDVKDTGRTTAEGLKILDVKTTVQTKAGPKNYTYELTVNGENRIIDGKWTGSSVMEHPDFIWSATDPRFRLNEFMAKAVSNNVALTLTDSQIASAVRTGNKADLAKVRGAIREVWAEAAPSGVFSADKMTQGTYNKTLNLVRQWNSNPWLRYQYESMETFLDAQLSRYYGRNGKFSIDLYKELNELLPQDHRIVDNVEERLRKAAADPTPMDRVVRSVKARVVEEAKGMATFAAAYLLKEAFKAIETRDANKMKEAALQLTRPGFWGSLALFSAVSRASEVGLTKLGAGGLTKAVVPMAVGMAAMQVLSGRFSPKDLAISTVSYVSTGVGVNLLADGMLYPLLFRATPAGWAMAAYTIGKLAVSLYAGEKLEHWLQSLLARKNSAPSSASVRERDGVALKVAAIAN